MNRLQIMFDRISGLRGLALLAMLAAGCDGTTGDDAGSGPGSRDGSPAAKAGATEDPSANAEGSTAEAEPEMIGPPEPEFIPIDRLVITGATVLSGFQKNADDVWAATALQDTTVVIESGEVVRLVASSSFQIGLGDVVVTGRDRFVIAAPFIVGARSEGEEASRWMEGGRLVDAALAGIGGVVLPEGLVDGPAGRCILDRIANFEIPAATPIGVDADGLRSFEDLMVVGTDSLPGDALESSIRERIAAGMDPLAPRHFLTRRVVDKTLFATI